MPLAPRLASLGRCTCSSSLTHPLRPKSTAAASSLSSTPLTTQTAAHLTQLHQLLTSYPLLSNTSWSARLERAQQDLLSARGPRIASELRSCPISPLRLSTLVARQLACALTRVHSNQQSSETSKAERRRLSRPLLTILSRAIAMSRSHSHPGGCTNCQKSSPSRKHSRMIAVSEGYIKRG